MRSHALDFSDSREMPHLLRKDKRLRYNGDGSNNLVEWDVIQMAKAAQPAFHRVLIDRAIPLEWETPFPAPVRRHGWFANFLVLPCLLMLLAIIF